MARLSVFHGARLAPHSPVRSRCLHPGQQQGRRWPSSSSSWVLRMRRFRVISCFASSTQQMNSLRAKGVMSLQAASAVEFAISASRRSTGSLCTTPPGTRLLVTEESRSASRLRRSSGSSSVPLSQPRHEARRSRCSRRSPRSSHRPRKQRTGGRPRSRSRGYNPQWRR